MPQSIREVMTADPVALTADRPIVEAADKMKQEQIGDVIVLDDSAQMCGIVTDRDIAIRAVAEGRDPQSTTIGEICTRDVRTMSPDDSVGDAIRLMRDEAIRRIPVVENGKPVGIVSLGDLAVTQDGRSVLAEISSAPADH